MEIMDLNLPGRGFSTTDASAGRCLVNQAQGKLGPGFGQADVDLDITVSLLLERLQQEEETRVSIYSSLQEVLQGDIKSLDRSLVRRIIHLASKDMRETQQENDELQLAAGKTLVALAGTFYNWVMYELQRHVDIMELPPIYFVITLGDVASTYVVEGLARAANLKFHIRDESPFPSCRAANYGLHVLPFFNLMSSSWLSSEDLELQQAAVKALGPAMGLLLHNERHRNTVFERLPCLLQQYEGGVDNIHVTMSLSQILEVAYDFEVPLPSGKLKSICFALHTQVCDIAQLPGSENQVAVFHCLRLLACLSPDQFISLVGSRLKTDKEASRVASLSIFSVIIAADLPEMSQKKCAVVQAMRCTLGDQSTEVKKAILHFIRTLLSVQGLDDWAWDLVAYIFKQFSLSSSQMKPKNRSSQDAEEEQSIRATCVEILENLDVSTSGMSQVLWPRLLEYIVPAQYSCTLTPVCRCLGDLAKQPQWEGEEAACVDPSKGAKLPKGQGLLARLLVVASALGDSSRAHSALRGLWALHRTIHPAVGEQWRIEVPILLSTIEGNPETSQDNVQWEHLLLKFLNMTLKTIGDDAWSIQLSLELQHQTASYACSSPEKSFLYKALGTTLASCQDVAHVKSQLRKSLKGTDYMNASEREQVVTILAFSAKGHLDLALATLEDFGAAMSKVQVSGIVGRLQDYHQGKRARTHRALILAYSRIAVHAPRTQLLTRVECDITQKVLQYYMTSCRVLGINIVNKDPDLKLTLIQSVTEISRAIQDADDSEIFQFTYKEELLGYMLDFMKEEPMDSLASPVRLRAMLAIKHLSKVKPSLNLDENRNILEDCLKCLLPLPAVQQLREEGETSEDSVQIQALHELSMKALGELMRGLLEEDPTENWFMEMFHLLESWIFSNKEWERDRALQASSQLLVAYRETAYCRLQEPLEQFGSLLGLLAPYTCASLATSRLWAADCILCLLHLQDQSRTTDAAEELRHLREELKAASPEAVLTASSQIAKVIGKYLPCNQALDFVGTIMDGMLSASPMCATAAGHWFCTTLRENGDALLNEVPDILGTIFIRMPTVQERSLRGFLLEGVGILAGFHLEAVTTSLLAKPLPMDSDTSELWRALGGDDFSTLHILHSLMEKIQHPASTEGSSEEGTAALGPLAATCASLEMLTTMHSSSVLRELLPELLCALLAQVGITVGQDMPMPTASIRRRQLRKGQVWKVGNPCRLSMETLACAIAKGLGEKVAADLCKAGTWPLLESPQTHPEGVCQLARALLPLGVITPHFIGQVLQWTSSTLENLRVTGTAFISQLMCDPIIEEQKLLKPVLCLLHQRARDSNNLVQQMAARGLGNIIYGAPEQLRKHQKAVLETLFQASFVPTRAEIMQEGMQALSNIFKHLGTDAGPLAQDAAVHIRPFFNHDNDSLRAVAFALFGALAGCMKRRQAFYKSQVRQSLGALLIHLEDPNPQVAKECRTTLGLCCPYLALRRVQAALAYHIQASEQGKQDQLLRDVCRHLAKEKPALLEGLCQAAQGHYMSPWPEVRMAAIQFTGILMEYAAPRSATQIKVAHLLSSLHTLRQDASQEVQDVATQVFETISKSPWGSTLQEEGDRGRTLPHIASLLCFGCLRPRSI